MRRLIVLAVMLVAALASLGYWAWLGRPVSMPDAPSARVACVSYTPFRRPGESPDQPGAFVSPRRIAHDLKRLSTRFDCVRTYAQGMGLSAVPRIARRFGMKVLMGVWLSDDRQANASEVRQAIGTAHANPGAIRAIVVGNEVLMRGELSPGRLVAYIDQVHRATGLPVTYADGWTLWQQYAHEAGLVHAVSFVTVHILPYWDTDPVPVNRAVHYVAAIYARMQQAFPNKRILIGETGWPSEGKPRRGAVPSRVSEARYVRRFLRFADAHDVSYNLIESFDQPWKRGLEGTVGGYWGLFDSHADPKFPLKGPVVEVARWWQGWLGAAVVALIFAALGGGGLRQRTLAALAGLTTGAALAASIRQMGHAFVGPWPWLLGGVALLAALATALATARELAAWCSNAARGHRHAPWLASPQAHALWLLALSYVNLLLVFDGRYRDYPIALFIVPALWLALCTLAGRSRGLDRVETRLMAAFAALSMVVVLWRGHGANAEVWMWALCNGLMISPWCAGYRADLATRQAKHAQQHRHRAGLGVVEHHRHDAADSRQPGNGGAAP
ncbi:glycoside hydrolase family 17 [Oleiagrimonas sp. C23AA]|uniref:glycoside hydrolase family 17 protein n=1 Tax=Oleiagrimonas sp. C23AA TaxID=2719047 RepID=UPI00197E59EB|nr:glycoside hydrolase family 17 [Oleiagrimonas sp. C23AA]